MISISLGIVRSVELKGLKEKQRALLKEAVAKSQWHDPIINAGIMNAPTNTFSLNQEPMTQLKVGIKQQLPRGDSLSYLRNIYLNKAEKVSQLIKLEKLKIVKKVRLSWSELYYWRQVRFILLKKKKSFTHLIDVTQAQYENNKSAQKNIFNARLHYSKVKGKIINAERSYQAASYSLERWLGASMAKKIHPNRQPKFKRLLSLDKIRLNSKKHPLIMRDESDIKIKEFNKQLKKEAFKPAIGVGLDYAKRERANNGQERSNFLSLGFSIQLPLHSANKQQKNYEASVNELKASQLF